MTRRVLVVLDDCGPGDALFVHFCLAALRRAIPGARFDCVASARAASVVELMGLFDSVIPSRIYEQRATGRWTLAARKAAAALLLLPRVAGRYDLAITFYWGSAILNALAWCAAPGRSHGYSNGVPGLVRGGLGRYDPAGDAMAQALRLMRTLGVEATPAVASGLEVAGGDTLTTSPMAGLAAFTYAVFHLGSDWACQQWLPARWAELADRIADRHDLLPVFTGVASEIEQINSVRARMRAPSLTLAGQTAPAELAALLRGARLCVTVDSLAFELAQVAAVPTVVLAGQSRVRLDAPTAAPVEIVNRTDAALRAAILDCKLRFVRAASGGCLNHACPMAGLRGIAVDDVLQAAGQVLALSIPGLEVPAI